MRFPVAVANVLLTAWIGGMWAIGYIAAPTLFGVLDDRQLAGQLAGQMFHVINWLGMVCGGVLLLLVFKRYGRNWRLWLLLIMVFILINNEFVLQPMMAALKAQGLVEGSEVKSRFGLLHGVASVLYLLVSCMGLALVAAGMGKPKSGG